MQYLWQCVDGVLTQTFENQEVILGDDSSPDGSPAICDEYVRKSNKVKIIHKRNGGLSDARNAGLNVAQCEYVMFLDCDDWRDDNDALCKIDVGLRESGADILIFGMKQYFSREYNYGDVRLPEKCDRIVRMGLIEKDDRRFVKRQLCEDIEWCCKLSREG